MASVEAVCDGDYCGAVSGSKFSCVPCGQTFISPWKWNFQGLCFR